MDFTAYHAREAGLEPAEIRDLNDFENSNRFTEREKQVLRYARTMTETPSNVPDPLFDELEASFTPEQMVELTAAIALENFSARFNDAFGIESQGFSG